MINNIQIPWPEWEITKVIGRGGFGTVYEIQKDILGKIETAALKVLSIPESPEEIDELYSQGYDDQSIAEHFKGYLYDIIGEYSIMVDLKGHANVVYCDEIKYVQHSDSIGWDVFIKMELLKPLTKVTSTDYDEDKVFHLGVDLCNALIHCNKQDIIHRDIKPQNIFVSKDGSYKLGDFGVAKVSDKTMSGTKIGTYEYMAPEVYRAQHYGSRVDIYSLGLVMYWMMNQKCTPFLPLPPQIPTASEKETARNRRLNGERLPPPANGSERLKAIVLKACAYDPKDRYASAQEMLIALQNVKNKTFEPIPAPVDLDVHREMTFDHSNNPAGKYLSLQVDNKEVHFTVPTDVKDGHTIRLAGKGKYDMSTGTSGDLYVLLHIKPAPIKYTPPVQQGVPNTKAKYAIVASIVVVFATLLLFFTKDNNSAKYVEPTKNPQTPVINVQSTAQHEHNWQSATCVRPETCMTCGATRGSILPHQWKAATYDSPEKCTICGSTRGTSLGYPLTWCREIENTNNPKAKETIDVSIGTWTDCFGTEQPDSIKFWVRQKSNLSDVEHIVYDVNSEYTKLTLTIVNAENNASNGENKITVYADDSIIHRSDWITNNTPAVQITLDISGVDKLKIECDTDINRDCYCLVSGLLFK